MSKLGIVGATALSLALVVATPAFAGERVGVGGRSTMNVGSGGFRDAQANTGSVSPSDAAASYCRQRWAYYDPASGKYMGDDGEWRPCLSRRGVQRRSAN
jgi:BA14K-like protein